ncbi:MAG: DUF2442 domain-containing protein [Verrucomicrobiales bacterium]|jgi:hypothetical protein|nr:DUF2442 domain-containing protein [Verrucomicrobiales bacterium]
MGAVEKIWFTQDRICVRTVAGAELSQPLRFFPALCRATDEQRRHWVQSPSGLHWPELDEDISFESFAWADDDPLTLCRR